MKDTILLNKLWKEVEAGRVNASSCGTLTIFKYTQSTHILDDWNEVNRQARGIIFHTDGTVVARPFPKFFNMHERSETEPQNLPWSEGVEVYEKMDGSCGIGYFGTVGPNTSDPLPINTHCTYLGQMPMWRLATPGSMESDQAIEGTKILNKIETVHGSLVQNENYIPTYSLSHLPTDCTPIFEIIYPENRIVVDYDGEAFLSLLAIFEHNGTEWHPRRVDQIAERCGFHRPERYNIDLRGEIPFEDNHEGYVCRFGNGFRVKVKSPTYLRIHRLLDSLTPKGIIALIRGHEYGVTVKQLPAEIARNFDDVRALVQGMFNTIMSDAYSNVNRLYKEVGENRTRKDYAIWIQNNVSNEECGFMFAILDEKESLEDNIWKLVAKKFKEITI